MIEVKEKSKKDHGRLEYLEKETEILVKALELKCEELGPGVDQLLMRNLAVYKEKADSVDSIER